MRRRGFLGVLLVALMSLILAPSASAADMSAKEYFRKECDHLGDKSSDVGSLSKDKRPVILVHGWTSNSGALSGMQAGIEQLAKGTLEFRSFDYRDVAESWPSKDKIAQCFAYYARWVSDVYKEAGGDGRVLVVGHSMGGLVPRFASSPEFAGKFALDATVLGGVVTINTPHRGSDWPLVLRYIAQEKLNAIVPANVLKGRGQSAVRCLAFHDNETPMPKGCAAPPYLPKGVFLSEISGDVTLDVRYALWSLGPLPLVGDTIVPIGSQTGYAGSYGSGQDAFNIPNGNEILVEAGNSVTCTVGSDAISERLRKGNFAQQLVGLYAKSLQEVTDQGINLFVSRLEVIRYTDIPEDLLYMKYRLLGVLAEASGAVPCGHSTILSNSSAQSHVTIALLNMSKKFIATEVRYIEPVDADGDPAPGWEGSPGVDFGANGLCSGASEVSVSDNVTDCGMPGLDACWPVKANPHFLRCALPLPPSPTGEVKGSSVLVYTDDAPGSIAAIADPTPWFLELSGQVRCSRLLAGAPPELPSNLSAWYFCDDGTYVVAANGSSPFNKENPRWSVNRVLQSEGSAGTPKPIEVIAAYAAKTAPDAEPSTWSFKTTGFGAVTPGMTIADAKSATSGVFSVGPDEESISPQCVTNTFTYIGGDAYTIDNPLTGFVSYGEFSFLTQSSKATGKIVAIYNVFNSPTHAPTSRWILPGTSTVGELKAAYSDFNLSWATSSSDAYTRQVAITQDGPGGLGATATSDEADGKAPDSSVIGEIGVGADATKVFDEGGGC